LNVPRYTEFEGVVIWHWKFFGRAQISRLVPGHSANEIRRKDDDEKVDGLSDGSQHPGKVGRYAIRPLNVVPQLRSSL
jgi:hypothetical protein